MILQDIKETKRYGHTFVRSDGRTDNVKTVYPPTNTVCGGYNKFFPHSWGSNEQFGTHAKLAWGVTLRLHYVPGDHGSHGGPTRSAPCDLVNFYLGTQVLLSIITFRHGLSRYPLQTFGLTPGDTTVRYV